MEEYKILSATAILGYGFPRKSFEEGLKRNPHAIAVDAGSTDPGPYYLGAGISFTDKEAVKRDLEFMISAGLERNIPVIIGTAGGSGARPHVEWCRKIIEEIAQEYNQCYRLANIYSDFDKQTVVDGLRTGYMKTAFDSFDIFIIPKHTNTRAGRIVKKGANFREGEGYELRN